MTNVYTIISGGHGLVVVIANVRTISHQTYVMLEIVQLDVDLLTNGHEALPTTCSQCHVLFWHGHGCYFYFTHYDAQLPIITVSEKEYSMCRWW